MKRRCLWWVMVGLGWIGMVGRGWGAFGLSASTGAYTVDTDAGLVFKVRRTDNGVSTQSAGDLMSLAYNGVEYQNPSRGSQINSGFDYLYTGVSAVSVSGQTVGSDYIKITVTAGDLTHYYLARRGYPHIYMATYFTTEPSTLGLCRYIVRIPSSLLPNGPEPSDIRNNTGAIESGDIFGLADGTTRSKHYSNMRLIDWDAIGATGSGVGIFIVRSTHEGDSGGPFYRSLLNQCGSDQEITYIVNYGEAQTEPFRTSILNGPYALVFTDGGQPDPDIDYGWIESAGLNLIGWVSDANRGTVSGTVAGIPQGFEAVVGFANPQAQYWTKPGADGSYVSRRMIPGTYTATLFKQELEVATASVTVTAGGNATRNLASTESTPTYIWRLGDWDGTPAGFRNGDKLTTMHPSDVRMAAWAPGPFDIETGTATDFPCVQFRGANSPAVIKFVLASRQIADLRLRIGTTVAYNGGRPRVTVNSWVSSIPPAPNQPKTRTITVGTYRGNNILYSYTIPSSALVRGQNTLSIEPVSGSSDLGPWLSAGWVYDAIELDGTPVRPPAAPAGLAATAGDAVAMLRWDPSPAAVSYTVRRATVDGGPYTVVAANLATAAYEDAGLENGRTYVYAVSAVNTVGESVLSEHAPVTPSNLYAHWRFDESEGSIAEDSAGAFDGTTAGSTSWALGRLGGSLHLINTGSGYLDLPAGLVRSLDDFTIATWVRTESTPTWSRLFDFGSGTDIYMFLAPVSADGTVRYAITTSSSVGEQQLNYDGTLSSSTWHHLAVTLSGSTGVLYIDGVAVDTNPLMTLRPSALGDTTQNYIGRSQWDDPYPRLSVDDFRMYRRALTGGEIAQLARPPGVPTGLAAMGGDGQVKLSWNPASDATGYRVKRAILSGGPYVPVADTGDAGYPNTGLENGSRYYFVVSSVNFGGESADASEVSARPTAASPPVLAISAVGGGAALSWPPDHTGWRLERQTNSLAVGYSTNWFPVPSSTEINLYPVSGDAGNDCLFFRLVYP